MEGFLVKFGTLPQMPDFWIRLHNVPHSKSTDSVGRWLGNAQGRWKRNTCIGKVTNKTLDLCSVASKVAIWLLIMPVRKVHETSKGAKSLKPTSAAKRLSRRKKESFALYIYKVLKETAGNKESKGINKRAMNIMNSLVFDVFDQLSSQAAQLIRSTNKHTLTAREIEACVKLLFPVDLAQHAIQEGRKAVEKFKA